MPNPSEEKSDKRDKPTTDVGLKEHDDSDIVSLLSTGAVKEAQSPDTAQLSKHVKKQQQTDEFLRLGVHGIFSMLLSILAPLYKRRRQDTASVPPNTTIRDTSNDR